MKRLFALLLAVTGTFALHSQCPLESLPKGTYSRYTPDASLINDLEQMFPESARPDAAVKLNEKVLYIVDSTDELEISFLHDGGVFPSTVGYYIYNSLNRVEQETDLFPDVNCARIGDTINIGNFSVGTSSNKHFEPILICAGTRIGFYIIAPQNSTSYKFWSYEAENSTNPDNFNHVSLTFVNQTFVIGFEDIYGGGDEDFNDVILMVRAAPADVINEIQTTCCCEEEITQGSLECYEGANWIITMSIVYLGFASVTSQELTNRFKEHHKAQAAHDRAVRARADRARAARERAVRVLADRARADRALAADIANSIRNINNEDYNNSNNVNYVINVNNDNDDNDDGPRPLSRLDWWQAFLCSIAALLFFAAIGICLWYRITAAPDVSGFDEPCPAIYSGAVAGAGVACMYASGVLGNFAKDK